MNQSKKCPECDGMWINGFSKGYHLGTQAALDEVMKKVESFEPGIETVTLTKKVTHFLHPDICLCVTCVQEASEKMKMDQKKDD